MSVEINGKVSYEGCVVDTYEENFAYDSYWYAVVWNGKTFIRVLYDSTAFGGCGGAEEDAPEELKEAYRRHLRAKALCERRAALIKIAEEAKLPSYTVLLPLLKVYGYYSNELKACARLLGTKSFRSTYRASLRQQLEGWLRGEGQYETPLSHRQMVSLTKVIH